jgi:small subunit ribosomal protein S21
MNLYGRKVIVKDGNVEKAIRKLKKKVAESGLLMDLQEKQTYTKPSVRKKVAKAMARKRWLKQLAQQNLGVKKP